MDMEGELQNEDNVIELDMKRAERLRTQSEVDAYSGDSTTMEASFDSCSENFNETKTERTILTTFKREKSEVDSRERKKKKVKFCDLEDEKCPPEDRAFPGVYLFTQPVHDYGVLHKSSLRTELGKVQKRKCIFENKLCEEQEENNGEKGGKISDIHFLGKGSEVPKTNRVENDCKIKKAAKMNELSHGSSLKRIRTHFVDETRPRKFAKRLTSSKHQSSYSAPSDLTDSRAVPQSSQVFDTESAIKTSGNSKKMTPLMRKVQASTNERGIELTFCHSLGSITPYRTEANAFVRRKNTIRMEQEKLSFDNTNLPCGNIKFKPVLELLNKDESTVLRPKINQSRIPKKIDGSFARTGQNLRGVKTLDRHDYVHEGEKQLSTLDNLKEATLEDLERGSVENDCAKSVPVIVKLRRPRLEPSRSGITIPTQSNLISGDSTSRSCKTESFELSLTELQVPTLIKNKSDSSLQNGAMREKTTDGRKPLNRSCSNPGPPSRKTQMQAKQQRNADQMNEKNPNYTNEMSSRSEVERLREEVQSQRRTIRQLSLRLPSESYKENQPLSLGHIPSTSVDNVLDALLRPCRPRQDAGETELQELVNELRAANKNLRSELQETRDQADLLEFRVLELTEGSDRFSEAGKATFSRDAGEKAESPQALNFEDLSLPLSIDSGLDLTADGKQRARNCVVEPTVHTESEDPLRATNQPAQQLVDSEGFEKDESSSSSTEQTSPTQTEEKQSDSVKFDVSEQQETRSTDADELSDIISNLQDYLDRPDRLQVTLLATAEKLRNLNSSVSDLETKISTMTQENQYLTETLSSLNEAQETRTEASGTESEMVSRKTPSLHSDLSDSDSDSPAGDTTLAKKRFENLSNFQESGIFEGSNDVHHTATQTEEEDDEAASHTEDNEQLHMENSKLHEALEELRQNYNQLLQKEKCSRCLEWAEVDRGESRALKEQLRVSQGARKALYEEKCELEEAENDARLMVQRLDSQLTAAREMELLLSASLSQEQEISRELHKKVKELQYLQAAEKERSFRQTLLEKESMDDRVVNLVLDKDTYMSQLEFVKHSLILLQVFRHFHLLNTWLSTVDGGRAPTEGLEAVDEDVQGSKAVKITDDGHFKERRNYQDINQPLTEFTYDQIVSSQPTLKSTVDSELKFSSTFLPLNEMMHQHPKFSEFLMPGFSDVSVQTESENECADGTGASKSSSNLSPNEADNLSALSSSASTMGKVEVQSKSTMTVEKDLLSLREGFYLEQIEALQEEKSILRKEFGQERSLSLEREGLMQATVEELQTQITDSERARAALQCEIEYLKEKEETLSKDFHKCMEKSRNDQARSSELHEMEKVALRRDFDARLAEVAEDRRRSSERCDELEHLLSALWRELETAGMGTQAGYEGRPHSAPIPSQGESEAKSQPSDTVNMSCSSNMLDAVRELVKSESSLRNKITELEKKESAYRETIQEADQIMLSHVTSYKQRIDELEAANELSEAKMKQLECSEGRLRSSLKNSARCDQDVRVAEFLEQLLTIEKSELMLKHKLWSLEKNEKELKIKVIEGEKVQESLRAELRDQDDLLRKMHNLQSENSAITQQLQRAHESVRRAIDKEQTECLLKGRVEELEFSENNLKKALQQAYATYAHKERRLNQQVSSFEEEAASLKKRLESASIKETQILESEVTLKRHVEALRAELEDAKRDMKAFSAEESSSRTEVSRLRSQLKQANGELTEAESINCNLRERLEASEQLKETLERSLEEHKRRHESDLLQLNLQVSQRDSRLEETESQLCELTQLHAAHELDFLAASPLEPVIRATRSLTAQLTLCDVCSQTHGTAIEDLRLQLDTLTDLLSGAPPHDDTHGEEKKSEQCEDSPRTSSPAPVPAPRLKRKLKRDFASSLRSSLKNRKKGGSTILEELEEKVRELEESVNTKDEELKLADSETTELSSKLAAAQEIAVSKEAEIFRIRQTIAELQHQLTVSLENNETEKRIVESKYKEEQNKIKQEAQLLGLQLKELTARGRMKDYIIETLVTHIRACFKSCNMDIIIVEVSRLQEKIKQREEMEEHYSASTADEDEGLQNETDHDVQSVCKLLRIPQEVVALPSDGPVTEELFSQYTEDSAVQTDENLSAPLMVHKQIQTIIESCFSQLTPTSVNSSTSENEPVSVLDLKTNEYNFKNSSLADSTIETSVSSDAGSNNVVPPDNVVVKCHQIEKLCPTSIHKSTQTSLQHLHKVGPHQKSFIPKILKPHNMHLKSEVRRAASPKSKSTSLNFDRGVAGLPDKSRTKISQPRSGPTTPAAHGLNRNHHTETGGTHQRATVFPLNVSSDVAVTSREHSTLRTSVKSTSESGEKNFNVLAQSNRCFQSPDRSIHCTYKKLKVSVVPQERLKPAWQTVRRITGNPSVALKSACEVNSNKFIPKPTNLKITRLVGNDGVVIAWELQNQDSVVGFQVIVSGKVVQSVKSPKRTKALITGLSSISSVSIGLVSVGADGRCSKPAVVTYDRSNTNFKNN